MTTLPDLVSTAWLAEHRDSVRLLDATWFLPTENRNAEAEFSAAHLPGAVRFDIDSVADRTTALPHMLPTAAAFGSAVGAMGIGNADRVVVYDRNAMAPAARVWWTFRVFGHDKVAVLDGGFDKWRAEGRSMSSGIPSLEPRLFKAVLRPALVSNRISVGVASRQGVVQVVDARPPGRFLGKDPEPRPGLRGGHVPGAKNVWFRSLLAPDGTLLPSGDLAARFEASGVDTTQLVIAMCGSGVTASLVAFALRAVGAADAAVYDGSWAEWGAPGDTAVET